MIDNFKDILNLAIKEDLPSGDITTESLGITNKKGVAHLVAKQDLVLSGSECFDRTMQAIAEEAQLDWFFADGETVLDRQTVASIKGNLIPVLKAERIALNFLGRLSGIATYTHQFVEQVKHTHCKILDTRKTTPGFRELEKKAVKDGGGENHRMSLSDRILIKENHIHMAGSLEKAIECALEKKHSFIEIEVKDLDEVKRACKYNIQQLMLDNMSNEEMAEALKHIPESINSEASGNMSLDRVKGVAEVGLNYISIGALTHSVPNADFSLLFQWEN